MKLINLNIFFFEDQQTIENDSETDIEKVILSFEVIEKVSACSRIFLRNEITNSNCLMFLKAELVENDSENLAPVLSSDADSKVTEDHDYNSSTTVEDDTPLMNSDENMKLNSNDNDVREEYTDSVLSSPTIDEDNSNDDVNVPAETGIELSSPNVYEVESNPTKSRVDQIIKEKDLGKIGKLILEGYGQLLLEKKSDDKIIKEFIHHLPIYLVSWK